MNWKSSPKVSVSGASLDAGVVSLALCSLTPLLSPRSSSHTQTEAHAESLHSTPRDPYGRSRGALILFVHLEVSLYRCCCCFFPSLFPPSPLRPPSPVAPQSSWPPCASHWVLLASGQDCPPFLCAYPTRQHTPPIQAYKEHMIGLLNVNTMTPAHPPAHVHHLKYSRATFPEKLKCSKLFHTSFRNISCSFIQSTHTHTTYYIFSTHMAQTGDAHVINRLRVEGEGLWQGTQVSSLDTPWRWLTVLPSCVRGASLTPLNPVHPRPPQLENARWPHNNTLFLSIPRTIAGSVVKCVW